MVTLNSYDDILIRDIPLLHPLSMDYKSWWREQKRRCIEGLWVGGTWVPPTLYYYVNFHTIRLNQKPHLPKSFGRPKLRDLEWDFFYAYTEARGFSGFALDDYSSGHKILLEETTDDFLKKYYPSTISSTGNRKRYIPSRQLMRSQYSKPMGPPLFENTLKNFMLLGSRGLGKALKNSELVYLPGGTTKLIGDVKIGEEILGANGLPTKITGVYPQGPKQLYQIKFRDGRSVEACKEHLWEVYYEGKKVVMSTEEIQKRYKSDRKKSSRVLSDTEYKIFLPKAEAAEFINKELPIDPYTLGVLIGAGSLTQQVKFTSNDPEILEFISYEVKKLKTKDAYILDHVGLNRHIQNLSLNCKSESKHIPQIYLKASKEQRLALLQGLMDTGGVACKKNGIVEFSTSSPKLVEDFLKLVRSLGIIARCLKRKTAHLDSYRIRLYTNESVFKLKRKLNNLTNKINPTFFKVAIISIEPSSVEEATCISVDNADRLFLTTDYIPTHNSYSVSGLIAHNFLFDGATAYNEETIKYPNPTEILVGAEKSDRSADILKKVRDAFDFLPGKQVLQDRTYPSPFYKQTRGSWEVNKELVAEYKKKHQGAWVTAGSKSSIKHRSFAANPFAAQGTRPLLMVLEEAGHFSNLKQVYTNTVDNFREGLRKIGMLMMLGTGGDMQAGTLDASEMFYEPDRYDILSFEDTWEGRGNIGYFVPAYLALNEFKDEMGRTDIEAAKQELLKVRKVKAGKSGSSEALNKEIQYRPVVPSEMFLTKTANIFPTAELRRRLSEVQVHNLYEGIEKKVNLFFDPTAKMYNGVYYEITNNLTAISTFPYDGDDKEGAVVIYEFPKLIDEQVPTGAYIIGCDPFKDDSETGKSLAAIYVMKTSKYPSTIGYDEIVASYIGRPYMGKNEVNEILYKLSLFYGNAKIYFENAVGNVKDYFEKIRRLDLLARQPVTVFNKKASYETGPQVIYGYPMSNQKIKWEALQYLRSFLLEEREEDKRNLDLITDPALLQELISFNMDGNFDRVMGLVGCIVGLQETNNLNKRKQQTQEEESDFYKEFSRVVINNNHLFNAKFSQTKTLLY